ncbi:MAG: hypothetical protein ACHQC8_06125 [Solirubrobacterales bacterium]|jgi:hypothetical protein
MAAKRKAKPRGPWTAEEIARNERAEETRALRDREKSTQERLEETLRLSRFVSELRQGLPSDVRT